MDGEQSVTNPASADGAKANPPPPAPGVGPRFYPCGQCGAKLEFAPGTDSLICPYCKHENIITHDADAAVAELDFATGLAELEAAAPMEETIAVVCTTCAATVSKPANVDSLSCPYCGSNIVTTGMNHRHIRPGSVLPFKVTRQQAQDAFRVWLGSRWFAPSALKKQGFLDAALNGLYLPYWTYDCHAASDYSGQRGEYYYVTETFTVTVNGKPQLRTRQVRHIRWYSAAGRVRDQFDDLLVLASRSLPGAVANELAPWDLASLRPYTDDYLSGFIAENYTVDLTGGFDVAKGMTVATIEASIRADIGGDEQRIAERRTRYSAITFKHILLPVWISAYRYMNKVFRFYVNARTGEVHGERPYSVWKITLLVVASLLAVGIIVLVVANRSAGR